MNAIAEHYGKKSPYFFFAPLTEAGKEAFNGNKGLWNEAIFAQYTQINIEALF